jgi:hypothetical protein
MPNPSSLKDLLNKSKAPVVVSAKEPAEVADAILKSKPGEVVKVSDVRNIVMVPNNLEELKKMISFAIGIVNLSFSGGFIKPAEDFVSTIAEFLLTNSTTPEGLHIFWCDVMRKKGFTWGKTFSEHSRTYPLLVDFASLSMKDKSIYKSAIAAVSFVGE